MMNNTENIISLFNNIKKKTHIKYPDLIFYYSNDEIYINYDIKTNILYYDYVKIHLILQKLNIGYYNIIELIRTCLEKCLNIKPNIIQPHRNLLYEKNLLQYAKDAEKYLNSLTKNYASEYVRMHSEMFNKYFYEEFLNKKGIIERNYLVCITMGLDNFKNVIKYWDNPVQFLKDSKTDDKDFDSYYIDNFIKVINSNKQRLLKENIELTNNEKCNIYITDLFKSFEEKTIKEFPDDIFYFSDGCCLARYNKKFNYFYFSRDIKNFLNESFLKNDLEIINLIKYSVSVLKLESIITPILESYTLSFIENYFISKFKFLYMFKLKKLINIKLHKKYKPKHYREEHKWNK